jgi:HEAT repeat protein
VANPVVLSPEAPSERVAVSLLLEPYLERFEGLEIASSTALSEVLQAALAARGSTARNALRAVASAEARLPGWSSGLTDVLVTRVSPTLEGLAAHGDHEIRRLALRLLIRAEPERGGASLARALSEPEHAIRQLALEVLEGIVVDEERQSGSAVERVAAPIERETIDHLVRALAVIGLQDPRWSMRTRAVELLTHLGTAWGAMAHGRSGGGALESTLLSALERDPSAFVRQAAAQGLAKLVAVQGTDGEAARAALRRAGVGDPEARVRRQARAALGDVRPAPR